MSETEQNTSTESNYSPQQRKAIYRNFLGKTRILQENVSSRTPRTLRSIMMNTDVINGDEETEDKVNHTDEVLLDSEVMSVSSNVLNRCSETLNKDTSPYDHTEFADKILSYVKLRPDRILEEPYWPTLADEVLKCLNVTPLYSFLLGTLKPLEKKQIERRKHTPRDAEVAVKRPENVQVVEKSEDGIEETVRKIKHLVSHYYKTHKRPLDFFQLILNPTDFGHTVENMLHVSFLVRDGLFRLVKDNNGKLVIYPTNKEALAQMKLKGDAANVQNVMSINSTQWQTLKEIYQLEKPMIDFEAHGHT